MSLSQRKFHLKGQVFGRWTVIEPAGYIGNNAYWSCKCKCGRMQLVRQISLTKGDSTQCNGCRIEGFEIRGRLRNKGKKKKDLIPKILSLSWR